MPSFAQLSTCIGYLLITVVVLNVLSIFIKLVFIKRVRVFEQIPISVLKPGDDTSPDVYVKSIILNEHPYYQIMLINKETGELVFHVLNAEKAYISEQDETETQPPYIELVWEVGTFRGTPIPRKSFLGLLDAKSLDRDFSGVSDIAGRVRETILHIPKNTLDMSGDPEYARRAQASDMVKGWFKRT